MIMPKIDIRSAHQVLKDLVGSRDLVGSLKAIGALKQQVYEDYYRAYCFTCYCFTVTTVWQPLLLRFRPNDIFLT